MGYVTKNVTQVYTLSLEKYIVFLLRSSKNSNITIEMKTLIPFYSPKHWKKTLCRCSAAAAAAAAALYCYIHLYCSTVYFCWEEAVIAASLHSFFRCWSVSMRVFFFVSAMVSFDPPFSFSRRPFSTVVSFL
jgi:hypothetical protein